MSEWEDVPNSGWEAVAPRSDAERLARFVTSIPQGINQGLYKGVMALPDLGGALMQRLGLASGPLPSEAVQQAGQQARDNAGVTYTPNIVPENNAERIGLNVGDAIGQTASTVIPGSVVAKSAAPTVAGLRIAPQTFGQTVGETLAASPGLQAGATAAGNLTTEYTGNPWLGMGASLAVPSVVGMGQRMLHAAPVPAMSAEAERRAILKTAQDEGIPVSFGNMTGSRGAQFFESVLSKLPFVGSRQAGLVEDAKSAFDRAAINKIPEVKGEGIGAYTPGARDMIGKRIGSKFDALENSTVVNIDPQVGTDLAKARADFSKNLEANMSPKVMAQLDELSTAPAAAVAGQSPQISGEVYKNIRSDLSKMLTSASGTDRDAVSGMIAALDGAVERSLPRDMVKDWQDARQSWSRHMMLKGATDARHNASTDMGHIPPGSLAARVGNDKEMERLAQVGTSFVGDKTPDSGTAMRQLILSGLIGGGAHFGAGVNPMLATLMAGSGVGLDAALNNPATRALLMHRYNNPQQSVVSRGLVATLAAKEAADAARQ